MRCSCKCSLEAASDTTNWQSYQTSCDVGVGGNKESNSWRDATSGQDKDSASQKDSALCPAKNDQRN